MLLLNAARRNDEIRRHLDEHDGAQQLLRPARCWRPGPARPPAASLHQQPEPPIINTTENGHTGI